VTANVPVKIVTATRGKVVRAEPISTLYARSEVDHVAGLGDLEDQMCNMTTAGYMGDRSPDRADAAVWGLSELSQVRTISVFGIF
jgi:phage terminase large subunit-like protein